MTTLQTKLDRAVAKLGGTSATARLSGIKRGRIDYWRFVGIPDWADAQVRKIIELANDPANLPEPRGARPAWAEAKLRLRERTKEKAEL